MYLYNMEACLKNKKGTSDFLSHNPDFFLTIPNFSIFTFSMNSEFTYHNIYSLILILSLHLTIFTCEKKGVNYEIKRCNYLFYCMSKTQNTFVTFFSQLYLNL